MKPRKTQEFQSCQKVSSVIETEPAVAVTNYSWNRFGEEDGETEQYQNGERKKDLHRSIVKTRGGVSFLLFTRKVVTQVASATAMPPFSSLEAEGKAGTLGSEALAVSACSVLDSGNFT